MTTLLYLQINFIGIVLLVIMYLNVTQSDAVKNSVDQKLFKLLIVSVIAVLIFDSGTWFIDGKTFRYAREINYITTIIYLILNPVTCFFCLLYGKSKLSVEKGLTFKSLLLYCLPVIINAIFVVVSLKTGWLFYIDEMNIYHRGEYLLITLILSFIYIFLMSVNVLKQARKKKNTISKEMYYYLFLFPIPPVFGAIIQMMYYGASMIWVGMLISIFIIFIHIQNKELYRDSLTGLYNRRFLENQLRDSSVLSLNRKCSFALMIDVDEFKYINDAFGHLTGDLALIEVANALKACKRNDFVLRYGGDEFFVFGQCSNILEVKKKISDIKNQIAQQNEKNDLPFTISVSIGHSISDEVECNTMAALIKKADESMYEIKNKMKNRKKSDFEK